MSLNESNKAETAERRTQEARALMRQVRVAAQCKYTPEGRVRICWRASVGKWQ